MMRMTRELGLLCFLVGCLMVVGCASSEATSESCQKTSDCSEVGHICYKGTCQDQTVPRPCAAASECLVGESCEGGFCGRPTAEDVVDDTDAADTTTGEDATAQDTSVEQEIEEDTDDIIPPTITARSPEPDATDQALDVSVSVTFSEEMFVKQLQDPTNFYVADASNNVVAGTTTYDAETFTATIAFDAPLAPWATYTVHVTSSVVDLALNSIVEAEWSFSTIPSEAYTFYDELARAYAPMIHQDVVDPQKDTPVAVDFDGDEEPFNNPSRLSRVSEPAVYYSVAETTSHYFITYVLYYPVYQLKSDSTPQAHTTNGVLVVAQKDGTRLGKLVVFETYTGGFSPGQIDSYLPECGANTEPFCPRTVDTTGSILPTYHTIPEAQYAEDGRRVRVYSMPLRHDLCHFAYSGGTSGYCAHSSERYIENTYAVLQLAESNDSVTAPDYTNHVGTYGLYPLPPLWWTQRTSFGSGAEFFYSDRFTYTSASGQPGHGDAIDMPRILNTDDVSSNTGLLSPWGWRADDNFGLPRGVWFVDPAYAISQRLDVGEGFATTAADYCYNLYTNIDRTDEAGCIPAE